MLATRTVEARTPSPGYKGERDTSLHEENTRKHTLRIVPIDVKIRLELVARYRQFTQLQVADQRNILDCIEMLKVFEE